jgi:hypothetical protein
MTIRLTRTAHGRRPQSLGLEIDDDGRATSWQNVGHRVGRFARALSAEEQQALQRALIAARGAEPETADPSGPISPSGVTEALVAEGLDLVLDTRSPPRGLGDLVGLLMTFRENLTDHPAAALELAVVGPPYRAALRHVGNDSLTVRLGSLTVKGTAFDEDDAIADQTVVTVDAAVDGPIGPGWTLPLAADLGLTAPRSGGFLTVTVGTPEVDVLGDAVLRPTELGWMTE